MYVDGFVIAVPKDRLDEYVAFSQICGEIWKALGAIDYVECVADEAPYGELTSFPRAVMAKEDETVVFSWITYPSKEVRDAIAPKAMEDPRLKGLPIPFDGKRMIYGGFRPLLQL
jgi:uncharacterized protein YbaA (DUF1428 family)